MECPVCYDIYKTPVLLPGCGHTLCMSCAEELIVEGNYLRCPECRLVYQLRKGVKSLPRNVALQRTIDEHASSQTRENIKCEAHPDDAATLYCKTCEKLICLKCFFSNTLRRGQTLHTGHDVDTSEDAFTKEKRLLEERCHDCEERRQAESEYISELEDTEQKLKTLLDEKLADIEKNKNSITTQLKQTTAKLKFTLKGSIARDTEYLQMALNSARERLVTMENDVIDAAHVLSQAQRSEISVDVNALKEARSRLNSLPVATEADRPPVSSFLKVEKFDTDVEVCLRDPSKALSYQTEVPRTPTLSTDDCIVSDTKAHITVKYNEQVRVNGMCIYIKEAMYKGMSEKNWERQEIDEITEGRGRVVLRDLERGTMYRMYAVSSNDFGDSSASNEIWFRTASDELECRST